MITIDELRDKLDNKARLIGLDIGTTKIVAMSLSKKIQFEA